MMNPLKNLVPLNVYEAIDKAGIADTKQVLFLSVWDIKKLTNLSTDEIILLKNRVAGFERPINFRGAELLRKEYFPNLVSTGCSGIDEIMDGGFRRGTLNEIYGESGSGKTQIAIQTAITNWSTGCVYICTEDLFPVKRFEQLKQSLPNYMKGVDYGKNIYIEHVTEAYELLSCVKGRLLVLLKQNKISIIIIDSIAALYRVESKNYVQRAEEMREVAFMLIKIAQEHNLSVLCINQVTSTFDGSDNVLPCLGLTWSNMISTRLWLKKTKKYVELKKIKNFNIDKDLAVRELEIIFSPYLPKKVTSFVILGSGIESF